ncbi:MAG: hypothetical protein LBQ77_02190 [Treponema sp.]|nr:hypothetical protein [Treponema sp.]
MDYIDRTYVGYDAQFKLIIDTVQVNTAGNTPIWNHIPEDAQTALQAAYAEWHAKHLAAEVPTRSKVEVEERFEARARTEPLLRNFCQRYFYNAPDEVTDAQLESMNLRPYDKTKTAHGKPQWRVAIEIEPSKTRTHTIRWHVAENDSRAVPDDCNGWVLVYKVLEADDPMPTDPEDFGHSQLVTRNPFVVEHKSSDEGKRIAYCGAFQSKSRGLKGDWGEIVAAVLP